MATQLFKFVTPRDPKKVSEGTGASVFDLGQLQAEPDYQSSLFSMLMTAMTTSGVTAEWKIERINSLVSRFATSENFLVPADIQARYGEWGGLYDQAMAILSPSVGVVEETAPAKVYDAARAAIIEKSGNGAWLTTQELLVIADNVAVHAIAGEQSLIVNQLATILKLYNFLKRYEASNGSVDAKTALKWLKMPIGLPKGFKVPKAKPAPRVQPDNSAQLAEIEALHAAYQRFGVAYDELLALAKSQGHKVLRAGESGTQGYELGNLNAEDLANLGRDTQAVLSSVKARVGDPLAQIMEDVAKAGTVSAKRLAVYLPADRPVMLVGGQVTPVADFQDYINSVIWNEEETGGVVIGSNGECGLRFPFKIANLRIVEQELLAYEPGYIAHIQNTLQGEFNEKTTRRLLRTEETHSTSMEREVTDERDTQTTDRFTMEKETSKTIQEDTEMYVNGELSASYGPVSLSIGAGYANNTSIGETNSEAVSYAKEVVQRSLQRVIEKTKEERSVTTINEFEEVNRHGLDNRGGDMHVVGVYRWLDQLNKVTIKTYDKRMMIELMIPQPAKYHLSNFVENKDLQVDVEEPVHPRELSLPGVGSVAVQSHKDINNTNYPLLAAAYGASISPAPEHFKVVTCSIADGGSKTNSASNIKESKDLIVPDGYRAYSITSAYSSDNGGSWANHIFVGGNWMVSTGAMGVASPIDFEGTANIITVRWNSAHIGASYRVQCILTDYAYEEWQIKTYNAIVDAYEKKKAAYDNAVAEAKANSGVRIRGTNPLYNKQLIRSELKKQALYLMSHCKFIDNVQVYEDGTVKSCCEAFDKGQVIKFVDSIFEWGNMTYSLYDYFYAKKSEWSLLYNISDPDPLMNNFLRAGEARLIIPVAKGKEIAVMNFLSLGRPYILDLLSMDILDVADEFITEDPLEEIVIYDIAPNAEPPLKPLVTPTTLTILECSSGGITPEKYPILGTSCNGQMTPVITTP